MWLLQKNITASSGESHNNKEAVYVKADRGKNRQKGLRLRIHLLPSKKTMGGEMVRNRAFTNLTGQRFGKLVALNHTRRPNKPGIFWNCKCDCGNTTTVISSRLMSGRTKSCGCLVAEKLKGNKLGLKHGH
jgi:ribosomal protein S27E